MKTPLFWNSQNTLSALMLPLAAAYEMAATLRRLMIRPVKLPVPVICVGNLTAGGGGKTPVALHIGRMLKEKGAGAFFLSRGYGGRLSGPILVATDSHTARDVGDEPLLLAQTLPTVIAKDRLAGALFAIQKGAKIIIMDDGFQNPHIAKTLSLLVLDGAVGIGNGRLLPAGPLREDAELGMKRAHAIIVVNRSTSIPPLPEDKPVFFASTRLGDGIPSLKGRKILAFCGIAYPQKFSATLAGLGAEITEFIPFPDHHNYTPHELKMLVARASKHQAVLVTTAKDAVRLPVPLREKTAIVDIALTFDNPAMLSTLIDYATGHAKA